MRLIDADALKKAFCNHCDGDEPCTEPCIDIGLIETAPTIDAVVVKHGEWSNRRTWVHDGEWYCTACDKEITIYMGEKRGNDRYKYCPNCGAKMKGEQE